MPDDPVLTSHPPERRRRSTVLVATACSCCCCCCIHAVGGVAGAIFGQLRGRKKAVENGEERERLEIRAADRYAANVYWLATLIIAVIAVFVAVAESRNESAGNTFWIAVFTIALGLPLGQLGASVLTLIYINVFPPVRKDACLRRLGRITLHAFLWGLIGFAVMVPFAFMIK